MEKAGLIFAIPPSFDLGVRLGELAELMRAADGFHLAALRLQTAGLPMDALGKRADILRDLGHQHDVSVMIDDHLALVEPHGLDGVHLTTPDAKALREARKTLGKDALFGVSSGASRHDGMIMGEIGCDYVGFGPLYDRGLVEETATVELFEWWSQMIEIPLVVESFGTADALATALPFVDFVSIGDEVFSQPTPANALQGLLQLIGK